MDFDLARDLVGKNREAPTELVVSQQHLFGEGSMLVVDVPAAEDLKMLREAFGGTRLATFFTHEGLRRNVDACGGFGCVPEEGGWDRILVYLPRTRERILWLARRLATMLRPEGQLLVVGGNSEGIRSLRKALEPHFGSVHKVESARHCQLISACDLRDPVEADPVGLVDVEAGGISMALGRAPGIFAAGRVDEGSALLIGHLPESLEGRVVDMGCGSGVLAALALRRWPGAHVLACDADAFALAAARRTLAEVDPTGTGWEVRASDAWEGVEGRFDLIVCNAPFHQGVATEYDTGRRMAIGAADALASGGQALFVCNRFLKIQDFLRMVFRKVDVLEDDGRFTVLRARSARPPHQRRLS